MTNGSPDISEEERRDALARLSTSMRQEWIARVERARRAGLNRQRNTGGTGRRAEIVIMAVLSVVFVLMVRQRIGLV